MADKEQEHSYYHPGGVPVTPQARRFGFEFPVYVSKEVFRGTCVAAGIPSSKDTHLEKRIWALLENCYKGLGKKLATEEDFLWYEFEHWYWLRQLARAKKMRRVKLAARLFLDPSTNGPWLYIFDKSNDTIDALEKGQPLDAGPTPQDDYHKELVSGEQ